MTAHAPKTAALSAYGQGLLSARGTSRLEAHLDACEPCRRHLRAMQVYQGLQTEARLQPVEVDFDRIELAVRREARRRARSIRLRKGSAAFSAVAAAVAAIAFTHQAWRAPTAEAPAAPPEASSRMAAAHTTEHASELEGLVTALVGQAFVERHGEREPLRLDTALHEGMGVHLEDAAQVHVQLVHGMGFSLHGPGTLRLTRLRSDGVLLVLPQGRLVNELDPELAADYVVQAGAYRIRVRGTRFQVEADSTTVALLLTRGRVDIEHAATGQTLERLQAPARWAAPEPPASQRNAARAELAAPYGVALPRLGTARLSLPDLADVERWRVGDEGLAASGRLALRLPGGPVAVTADLQNGRTLRHVVPVAEEASEVPPSALRPLMAELTTGPPAGTLAPEAISPVVRKALPRLRGCYERSLKRRPDLQGRVSLRVTVARSGRVQQLKLASEHELPRRLATCLRAQAGSWRFPAPEGGPATFELPLSLSPHP